MTIGILVPIVIFFGLCVWMAHVMAAAGVANIGQKHQSD